MNWWQGLITSVVPVLITLVITNVADERRRSADANVRAADRNEERHAQADARRAAIEDHWRNERLDRLTALVALSAEINRNASDCATYLRLARSFPEAAQLGDVLRIVIARPRVSQAETLLAGMGGSAA